MRIGEIYFIDNYVEVIWNYKSIRGNEDEKDKNKILGNIYI